MDRAERAALAQALERENMAEIERVGIAKRIRQARKEAGLSQPEMADALGVIARTYQNYESVKEPRTPWASDERHRQGHGQDDRVADPRVCRTASCGGGR
jgi:DNA-binding XRE family transcriptional regulator